MANDRFDAQKDVQSLLRRKEFDDLAAYPKGARTSEEPSSDELARSTSTSSSKGSTVAT